MGDIFSAIAQYGIFPVVVGVVLYLLVLWQRKREDRKRKNEEAAQKLEAEKQESEKEIERRKQEMERDLRILEQLKDLIRPKHTVEEQNNDLQTNSFIIKQLNCLVAEGCDRAYMFTCHNGGQDVLGRGLLKISITQEAIGDNIMPIMNRYLNVPRTLFPILYSELNKHDYYNIDNIEDIKKTDPFTYQFLHEHGVNMAMFRAIKRDDGLIVGFVGMEYIHKTCEDIKKAGKNIDKKTNRITGALLGQGN